jgi:hypothetical protein
VWLLALRLTPEDGTPGGPPYAQVAFAALLLCPAAVGAIGARGHSGPVLVAAGIFCALLSVIAFSGVTLVFLVPAAVFLTTAGDADRFARVRVENRRVLAVALAAVLVALAAAFAGFGIVGLLAGVLLVPIVGLATRQRRGSGHRRPEMVAATLVVALALGAGANLFGSTEEICWVEHATTGGPRYETIPPADGPQSIGEPGTDVVATGCDSGVPTIWAAAVSLAMLVSALALAQVATLLGPPSSEARRHSP